MLVYRVEDKNGFGMYRPGTALSLWTMASGEHDCALHPAPGESPLLMGELKKKLSESSLRDFSFGFKNKRQFLRWVYDPACRRKMKELGGKLCVYRVDERYACWDDTQLMFLMHKAEKVVEWEVTRFDEHR